MFKYLLDQILQGRKRYSSAHLILFVDLPTSSQISNDVLVAMKGLEVMNAINLSMSFQIKNGRVKAVILLCILLFFNIIVFVVSCRFFFAKTCHCMPVCSAESPNMVQMSRYV